MDTNSASLIRRRLAAAAASERASLAMLTELDLPESVVERVSSPLTMRNRAAGWIHSPEVDLINFECDVPAPELIRLARARFAARIERKRIRRARYWRSQGQVPRDFDTATMRLSSRELSGTRPEYIIMDDIHAEMPGDDIKGKILGWYDEHLDHSSH